MGPSSCHGGSCILSGLGVASRRAVVCRGGGRSVQHGAGLWPAIACWGGATCRGGVARPAWNGPVARNGLPGWRRSAGLAEACRAGGGLPGWRLPSGSAAASSMEQIRAARTVRRGVVRNAALWQRRLLSWEQRTRFRELSCSVREASSTRFVCCTTG